MIKLTKLFNLTDIIRLLPPDQKLPEEDDTEDWIEDDGPNELINESSSNMESDSWNISNSGEDEEDEENAYSSSFNSNSSSYSSSLRDYDYDRFRISPDSTSPWRRPARYSSSSSFAYPGDMSEDDPSSPIHVLTTKPRPIPDFSDTPTSYGSSGTPLRPISSSKIEAPSSVLDNPARRPGSDFFSNNSNSSITSTVVVPLSSQSVDLMTPTTPTIVSSSFTSRGSTAININNPHNPHVTFNNSPKDPNVGLTSPRDDELMELIPTNYDQLSSVSSSLSMTSGIAPEISMSMHSQSVSYSLTQSHRIRGPSSGISFGEGRMQSMTPMRNSYQQQQHPGRRRHGDTSSGSFSSDSEDGGCADPVVLRSSGRRVKTVRRPECNFKVSVVGSDYENGILYVAVMFMERTFLNSFSVKSKQLTPLYTWNEPLDIVWVSMNSLFKVVGVTVVRHISKLYTSAPQTSSNDTATQSSTSCYYETFIQCFDETKRHYIGEKTANAQKMQFVIDKGTQGSSVSSSLTVESRFLHTISSHSVTLYTVSSLRKSPHTSIYTISKPPNKMLVVCNEFLWSKYTDSTKIFHCLFVVNDKKSGKGVRCSYKSVSLASTRPRVLSDAVFSLCFTLTMRFNTFDECLPLPYVLRDSSRTNRRPIPRRVPLPSINLVTLRSGVSCLCIQHETLNDSAPVSVILLALKARIDFSIPIPQSGKDMKSLRVNFVPFYDYLLIYIPGIYLHMLDVSSKHNPTAGLIFTKSCENTAPLPSPSKVSFPAVGPLYFRGFSRHRLLVDTRTSDVLEYGVSSTGLLNLVDEKCKDSVFLCKILHAARMHFKDDTLINDIFVRMLKAHPRQTTVELLREYVLGETYFKLQNDLPPEVTLGIPSTTVDQDRTLVKGLKVCGYLNDVSVVPMTSPRGRRAFEIVQPYALNSLWWESVRDKEAARMNSPTGNVHSRHSLSSSAPTSSSPRLQQNDELKLRSISVNEKSPYLKLFRDPDGNLLNDTMVKTPTGDSIDDVIWGMLTNIIKHNFSRTGQKMSPSIAQSYAEMAHEVQSQVVELLFAKIIASFSDDNYEEETDGQKKSSLKMKRAAHMKKLNLFIVLENMLNMIVEQGGILYPTGFIKKFSYLGYQCLSDTVFMQYVEKGTIRITKDFVWTLYMRGVHLKKPEFFYRVASRLLWYEMTEIVLSKPPPPMYVVDYWFSKNYKALTYGKIEITDNSSMFIPLTQVLKILRICSEETKLLVYPSPQKKYSPSVSESQMEITTILKVIEGLTFEYCFKYLDLDTSEKTEDD